MNKKLLFIPIFIAILPIVFSITTDLNHDGYVDVKDISLYQSLYPRCFAIYDKSIPGNLASVIQTSNNIDITCNDLLDELDTNKDGTQDYPLSYLQLNYADGECISNLVPGDLNGDGYVDPADIVLFEANMIENANSQGICKKLTNPHCEIKSGEIYDNLCQKLIHYSTLKLFIEKNVVIENENFDRNFKDYLQGKYVQSECSDEVDNDGDGSSDLDDLDCFNKFTGVR